jgi:diadenosine tetraphosphate (Ap4A) HIT family hydrolase
MPGIRPDGTRAGCITCRLNRGEWTSPPGGTIYRDRLWVLEHAIEPIPLVGWLVLKPYRHVEAFADLSEEEAASFGPLTHCITRAMTELLHPAKIYLSLYAEAQDFPHVHIHLIPRFDDTPADRRGPHVFRYLSEAGASGRNGGDVGAAARLAEQMREILASEGRLPTHH